LLREHKRQAMRNQKTVVYTKADAKNLFNTNPSGVNNKEQE